MKPRANVAKTIEKMLKKHGRRWNQAHRIQKNGIEKMMIANEHLLYILNAEKLDGVNDAWIATAKESMQNYIVTERRWEKVIPDNRLQSGNVVVEYSNLRKMIVIENEYGTKMIKTGAKGFVIYIKLEDLINAFRIFQKEELTLYFYKSPYHFGKTRTDKASGLEVNLNPFVIEDSGNQLVCCPMKYGF